MSKYNLLFTLDYEIHGNGDGNPMELMVEPTYRLMSLLEKYGQKLTIMADVAEILCFRRYREQYGRDDYHVADIEKQLCDAIRRGHDVQLHVHSSYFKAVHQNEAFDQCIEEYNMAALPIERIDEMVGECVAYLENLLCPIKKDYKVWLFRAANWSMMPTENLYRVLVKHGITHDTSVYKGGVQGGNVCYDYRNAYDNLLAYPASMTNINERDEQGTLVEMPIYTEMRPFWDFVTPMRVFRMIRAKFHRHKENKNTENREENIKDNLTKNDESQVTCSNSQSTAPYSAQEQALGQTNDQLLATDTDKSYPLDSSEKNPSLHDSQKMPKNIGESELQANADKNDRSKLTLKSFFRLSPLKMDFNQVNSRGLKRMMRNIMRRVENGETIVDRVDVVLIGHSKTFVLYNEKTLEPFLKWVSKNIY